MSAEAGRNITQKEFAKWMRINVATYNRAERGLPIRDLTKMQIAKTLERDIDSITWTK